ncbi:MAG: hypothetical protein V3T81_06425, partial [Thermoanaerobaculia bacterium]
MGLEEAMNHRPDPKRSPCVVGLALLVFASTLIAVPLLAQDSEVTVTSADPSTAEQGTVNLDVTITGSGFAKGAKAFFFVHDPTDPMAREPGGITVRSTKVRGSKKLVANIKIAVNAAEGDFDIEVEIEVEPFRIGKGTRLFNVKASP